MRQLSLFISWLVIFSLFTSTSFATTTVIDLNTTSVDSVEEVVTAKEAPVKRKYNPPKKRVAPWSFERSRDERRAEKQIILRNTPFPREEFTRRAMQRFYNAYPYKKRRQR